MAAGEGVGGSCVSAGFLGAAQIADINMVSRGSMDHESLSRRLNPEDESFFVLDILLLFRVRVMVGFSSRSGGRTCKSARQL